MDEFVRRHRLCSQVIFLRCCYCTWSSSREQHSHPHIMFLQCLSILFLELKNREYYMTHDVRPPFTYATLIRQVG
jgi:hypothetical protein